MGAGVLRVRRDGRGVAREAEVRPVLHQELQRALRPVDHAQDVQGAAVGERSPLGAPQAVVGCVLDASVRSRITSSRKCSNWMGFIRHRSAPASYIFLMLSCSGNAVIARTLIERVSAFSRIERHSDSPSTRGIMTSMITRSGWRLPILMPAS